MKTIDEGAKEYFSTIPGTHNYTGVDEMWINVFKAGAKFAQTWIPVEEELPKSGDEIIAKNDTYKEWFRFSESEYNDSEYLKCNYTHWRPIEYKL